MLELLKENAISVFIFAFLITLCLFIIYIRAKRRIMETDLYTGLEFDLTYVCLVLSSLYLPFYLIFFFVKKDTDFYWFIVFWAVGFILALYFFLRDRAKIKRKLEKK